MEWTVGYGLLASGCLLASVMEDDHDATRYGSAMAVSWLISWFALIMLGSEWCFALIIPVDGAIGLMFALEIAKHPRRRAAQIIFALFVLEMTAHAIFTRVDAFGSYLHFLTINAIFVAQVITAGGSNVYATVRRWGHGRTRVAGISDRRVF